MARKVLLVDDSRELLDAYVAFLQVSTPHEVRSATTGREALEIIRTWRPDVVVTDVIMPDMNGLELISRMRSELPPPLPVIIAMSGFPEFEREARRRGARVFHPKPIDTDELVALIESLIGEREPPDHLRIITQARRQQASEMAEAAVTATLARRPYFREVMQLNSRLVSRYFGGADVGVLTMSGGHMRVFAASDHRWEVGTRPEAILGYGLGVIESGSTLIVPDLAALSALTSRGPVPDARLLAAAPLRGPEGVTIGALALADRRPAPFDAHDLDILEHLAARSAAVFAGADGGPPREPGILPDESWRYLLRAEVEHLRPDGALIIALASLPPKTAGPTIPVSSREVLVAVQRVFERLLALLPPRTALGRLTPATLAVLGLGEDVETVERSLLAIIASLEDEPPRACIGLLTMTGLAPTDGGVALLEIGQWLLSAALARGPATILRLRLGPEPVAPRLAAA
jgi:CheY-like chemotaxis protein